MTHREERDCGSFALSLGQKQWVCSCSHLMYIVCISLLVVLLNLKLRTYK